MGPTNVALVNLFQADQSLRDAQRRLDEASRSVRVQERRVRDLQEKLTLAQTQLREHQTKASQMDLEIKTRDEKIEKLRKQQQNSKNLKEYQAFLTEINTEKIDKGKEEEELLKVMELVEKQQKEVADLTGQIEADQKKLDETRQQLGAKISELQAVVDKLQAEREEVAASVPGKALSTFERIAERWDGEAMAALGKPDRRREEYVCMACNMSLVTDVYNRLHSRDDMVFCPNCQRMLYIPKELTPEAAINKPKERKERRGSAQPAVVGRQTSAADISRSITPEADEPVATEGKTEVHQD